MESKPFRAHSPDQKENKKLGPKLTSITRIVPFELHAHLCKYFPEMELLKNEFRYAIAELVWSGHDEGRTHSRYADAITFHYAELDARFGPMQFETFNHLLGLYEVTNQWWQDTGDTKPYRMTPRLRVCMETFTDLLADRICTMTRSNGIIALTPPKPIRSTCSGTTTKARHSVINDSTVNLVQVNTHNLQELTNQLQSAIDHKLGMSADQSNLSEYTVSELELRRVRSVAQRILILANANYGGQGSVVHVYSESGAGRLYCEGTNLQNAPGVVKTHALAGHWDYDFSNCHFSLIDQMANRFKCTSYAIRHYIQNKSEIRKKIASDLGLSITDVKNVLIAMMYGARLTSREKNAIAKDVGVEKAKLLMSHDQVRHIYDDLKNTRKAILTGWSSRSANGGFTNEFGKTISNDASSEQKLAHLLQGAERLALELAFTWTMENKKNSVVLLQHDGFISHTKLDVSAIEKYVEKESGYVLRLEEEKIRPDFERFLRGG